MKNLALFVVSRYKKALYSRPTARRMIRRELEAVLVTLRSCGRPLDVELQAVAKCVEIMTRAL